MPVMAILKRRLDRMKSLALVATAERQGEIGSGVDCQRSIGCLLCADSPQDAFALTGGIRRGQLDRADDPIDVVKAKLVQAGQHSRQRSSQARPDQGGGLLRA